LRHFTRVQSEISEEELEGVTVGPWCFESSNEIIWAKDEWKLWNAGIIDPLVEWENHWKRYEF
jgi:hypothetical protein